MPHEVVVVGSANVDLVVPVDRHPTTGETLLGGHLKRHPGGKGANQAVASARSGAARTAMVACLGTDQEADLLLRSLERADVDTSLIDRGRLPTGVALIAVLPAGDNTIIVAPGANGELQLTEQQRVAVRDADVVLAQLEVPLETVLEAAKLKGPDTTFILNAAPSRELPEELLRLTDVLVVNEHEARDLSGGADSRAAATVLLEHVESVVITLGSEGALVAQQGTGPQHQEAFPVEAVDTTGAGDAFCGVLAAGLARRRSLVEAVRHAAAAGALATQRDGAQEAMPSAVEVGALAEPGPRRPTR